MDYVNVVLITTFKTQKGSRVAVCIWRYRKLSDLINYFNLSSEDEQKSYGFGTS